MTETVKMKVNEKQLIATMKDAFTNDHAVITELAQNARRAGATEVKFTTFGINSINDDDKEDSKFILQVTDNGKGIDDLQTLLSVASSGWDQETVDEENPFGMGFLIAVYSCDSLTVKSKGKMFKATKESLLNLDEIKVEACDYDEGTCIIMNGVELNTVANQIGFTSLVTKLLAGFPIDVYLHCADVDSPQYLIERTCAEANLIRSKKFHKFDYDHGTVYLHHDYGFHTYASIPEFFQGLPVQTINRSIYSMVNTKEPAAVIFLNKSIGTIRLPDRDKFINNSEVNEKVTAMLNQAETDLLTLKKDDYEFLAKYFMALKKYNLLSFFNKFPTIPNRLASEFHDTNLDNYDNNYEACDDEWLLSSFNKDIVLGELGSLKHKVITYDSDLSNFFSIQEGTIDAFAVVYLLDHLSCVDNEFSYVLIDRDSLHDKHWIFENSVTFQSLVDKVKIEVELPRDCAVKKGFYHDIGIQLCKSFSISLQVGTEVFNVNNVTTDYCLTDKGALLPDGCNDNCIVRSLKCYQYEYSFDESGLSSDIDSFNEWIKLERSFGDPSKLIKAHLEGNDFSHLVGQKFSLEFVDKDIIINQQL